MIRTFLIATFLATPALADPVTVLDVVLHSSGTSTRFDVTVAHPDTGWDHYADGWQVEAEDGTVLGLRVLHHPHVDEQPFTRSLTVTLPDDVTEVFIRARCSVDGWNAGRTRVPVP